MPRAQTFRKPSNRAARVVKRGAAHDAVGKLEHGQDVYILTYGQFSLIDALVAILDQTGPADVVLASWTVADAHLQETAHYLEAAAIRSFRMVVDDSFRSRQPAYFRRMRELFGADCIREVRTHAKFLVVTNDDWNIVVRTSMNLNNNPRLENLEISDDAGFAQFMLSNVDEIFANVDEDTAHGHEPDITESPPPYALVEAKQLEFENLTIPETTHAA